MYAQKIAFIEIEYIENEIASIIDFGQCLNSNSDSTLRWPSISPNF